MQMTDSASPLEADGLMRRAEAATGLHDWGTPAFQPALDRLCRALVDEAELPEAAAAGTAANIERLLGNRLRIYADRTAFPEIAAQQIIAPLVVTGLPRSGTTILHALLAQDPAVRSPMKWEVDQPSPPPRTATLHSDPRIAQSAAAVAALPATFRAMHTVGAELPEECNSIQMMAFLSPNFGATAHIPSYMDWLLTEADMRPAYAFHQHVLQHLQAFAPASRWVLKAPPHLWWLDQLFETYPDAQVVMTHRDPAQVMASNASLIEWLRSQVRPVDPVALGHEQIEHWRLGVQRSTGYRDSGQHAGQFLDTHYADFIADPMAVVAAIYARFELQLTDAAQQAMTHFLGRNRQGQHGKHVYAADTYGMSAPVLHREFGDYIRRFGIKLA